MSSARKNLRTVAILSLAEGIIVFLWLLSFPTNRQGYSLLRLSSLTAVLLIALLSAVIFVTLRPQKEPVKFIAPLVDLKGKILFSFLLSAVALFLWIVILFKEQCLVYISESTYVRLVPLALYGLLLCAQTGIFLLSMGANRNTNLENAKPIGKSTLIVGGIFLAAWLLIWVTHLGLIHDVVGLSWGPPGAPVTFAQVNLVLAVSFLLTFGFLLIQSRLRQVPASLFSIRDILIFIALWGLAVVLWWQQPMRPTHFTPPPMPPNNEYYPYSDAAIFDRASYHLLYGIGFNNQLVRRPLYVGMLALLHKIAGPSYDDTIFLQILLLALIPGLVFLLTSKLSNRLAGLLAGGSLILREKNAIELSGKIVTSHAKLMMSDMVTLLGIALFLYITVKLLFKESRSDWQLAISGACLGLVALIRTQVLILVLPLLLFIFLSQRPWRRAFRAAIFPLLGLLLVLAPWVWRNWNLTGTFVLDDRGEEQLLARDYSLNPVSLPAPLTGETQDEFSARLKKDVLTFAATHSGDVLFFVSNHFFRNLIASALYIAPIYSTDSPATLIEHLPFWGEWNGQLPLASSLSVLINLALLATGIGLAARKEKYAGWFPLVVFLFYNFGNALVRSSGWRFSLPVDWIALVYFSIGLAYLPSKIKLLFSCDVPRPATEKVTEQSPILRAGILVLLLLLGASIPIAERLGQTRNYDHLTENAKADLALNQAVASAAVKAFLEQKDAVMVSGIALYPRYVRPNGRFSLEDAPVPKDSKFLYFWLINQGDYQIILPLQSSPEGIPHTAVLSVIGCREGNYISALAVIVHEPAKQILLRDPTSPLTCPATQQ